MVGAALALVLTAQQVKALNQAYNEGSLYGIGRYTQAVILTESSACMHKTGDDGNSFGCGQLQVATARKVCRCKVTAKQLIRDDKTNMRITAQFLSECFHQFYPDTSRALVCYNSGAPAASKATANQVRQSRYVRKVKAYLRQLQQIPVDTK
jgi:hypothetical protein